MHGDFSRDTFSGLHRFSRVLMQQGRVLLDADWNEQTSILLHYLRALAADVIGPHGGGPTAFQIGCEDPDGNAMRYDFTIGFGHYWVDGILVEHEPPGGYLQRPPSQGQAGRNEAVSADGTLRPYSGHGAGGTHPPTTYGGQPYFTFGDDDHLQAGQSYLVYLDVWEQMLTHLQAAHVREVALGGPDTAARARVVWQVRVMDQRDIRDDGQDASCEDLMQALAPRPRWLRARARVPEPSDEPCIIPPEASYRGLENQLYRVEIHAGGTMESSLAGPTFKWSRDNGSVVFGVRALSGNLATLETLGPDDRRTLVENDWVELVDDRTALRGQAGPLARVESVDRLTFQVTLSMPGGESPPPFEAELHPVLRRWDQGSEAISVQEGRWVDLEDGVQVLFERGGTYRAGDYWLIPARTATGDVLWPTEEDDDGVPRPQAVPPHGVEHHYAPLGRITLDGTGTVSCSSDQDCRCILRPLCPPPTPANQIKVDENQFVLRDAAAEEAVPVKTVRRRK